MSVIESSIEWNMRQFAKYMGIQPTEKEYSAFMKGVHKRRSLVISPDIYLLVCSYLDSRSIITFTTSCKSHMSNYERIWQLYARYMKYTKSTIPQQEFRIIRNSIGLDQYYGWESRDDFYSYNESKQMDSLKHEEACINELYKTVQNMIPSNLHYKTTRFTHIGEIKARVKDRDAIYNKLPHKIKDFLMDFKFVSVKNKYCTYYTIKQTPDTRLFGYNNAWENGKILLKWISNEYNTDPDYDFDYDNVPSQSADSPDEFIYEEGGRRVRDMYRTRVKPHFVGVALNSWCQCMCERCEGDCQRTTVCEGSH